MSRERRLSQLEGSIGRAPLGNIPDSEVDLYCDACLGPRPHRRRVDAARAQVMAAGWDGMSSGGSSVEERRAILDAENDAALLFLAGQDARAEPTFVCRGCGARHETIDAKVLRVRREAGLE